MFPTWWLGRHCCSAVASQQHRAGLIPSWPASTFQLKNLPVKWNGDSKLLEVPQSVCLY